MEQVEKYNWSLALVCVILIIAFCIQSYRLTNTAYPKNVNIPSNEQINAYCVSKGYEFGWLSSSDCKVNEVQCFRQVGTLKDVPCVKWMTVQ
jgi:hypothetical protein